MTRDEITQMVEQLLGMGMSAIETGLFVQAALVGLPVYDPGAWEI